MTIKVLKSNPVAKAMQNKRFHEKVQDNRKVNYKRTDNKNAIVDSINQEEDHEYDLEDEWYETWCD